MTWHGVPFIARELGVTESVVRKWIREGQIRAIRVGGKLLRVDERELGKFIRESEARVMRRSAR